MTCPEKKTRGTLKSRILTTVLLAATVIACSAYGETRGVLSCEEDKEVLVLGEVATPGYVSLWKLNDTRTETVLKAAGKVTANADLKNAHILVPLKDGTYKHVDLDLSSDGHISKQARYIKAGDIVYIPLRKAEQSTLSGFCIQL